MSLITRLLDAALGPPRRHCFICMKSTPPEAPLVAGAPVDPLIAWAPDSALCPACAATVSALNRLMSASDPDQA